MYFGDGKEERMAAFLQVEIPASSPKFAKRRKEYWERRSEAAQIGKAMGRAKMIDALIAHNPAYNRELLETEDQRFGEGALADRYGSTFMKSRKMKDDHMSWGQWYHFLRNPNSPLWERNGILKAAYKSTRLAMGQQVPISGAYWNRQKQAENKNRSK